MNEIEKKYFEAFKAYTKEPLDMPMFREMENGKSFDFYIRPAESDLTNDIFGDIECYRTKDLQDIIFFKGVLCIDAANYQKEIVFRVNANPQTINGYVPDFIIENDFISFFKFAIEIDGHEWHEKTKEQAANDRRKDRAYLKNRVLPIRFTGTEVFHDSITCIKDSLEIIAFQLESFATQEIINGVN